MFGVERGKIMYMGMRRWIGLVVWKMADGELVSQAVPYTWRVGGMG